MDRKKFIGGSDLAAVVNAPPYGCARKLWYEKRGVEPDYPKPFAGHLIRGTKLEPLIVEEYVERTGRKVRKAKHLKGAKGHEGGALDRVILGDERGPGVLECKTANERVFREFQRAGVSLGYQLQIQWYMGLAGYRWGAFAILEPSNWRFETFEVGFDAQAFDLVREMVAGFWLMVEGQGEPDRLPANDRRCAKCEYRFSCQGEAMLEAAGAPSDDLIQIDGVGRLAQEYLALREVRDDAEAAMESIKADLVDLVGNEPGAIDCGYRVSLKPQVSSRINSELLKRNHPEVYQQVLRPSVSRPLRVVPA